MSRAVYAAVDLVRIGWCEIYRQRAPDGSTSEIVAVPSLVSYEAKEYLRVVTDGDKVIVTVEKRS